MRKFRGIFFHRQAEKLDSTLQQTGQDMLEWGLSVGSFKRVNGPIKAQRVRKRDADDAVGIASEVVTADSLIRIIKAAVRQTSPFVLSVYTYVFRPTSNHAPPSSSPLCLIATGLDVTVLKISIHVRGGMSRSLPKPYAEPDD